MLVSVPAFDVLAATTPDGAGRHDERAGDGEIGDRRPAG